MHVYMLHLFLTVYYTYMYELFMLFGYYDVIPITIIRKSCSCPKNI